MALMKKYRKQVAFTLLATGAITMLPIDVNATENVAKDVAGLIAGTATNAAAAGYIATLPANATDLGTAHPDNELLVDQATFNTDYQLDTLITEAMRLSQIFTSKTDGLEYTNTHKYLNLNDSATKTAFENLTNILANPATFTSKGIKAHIADIAADLKAAVDAVKQLTPITASAHTYKAAIDELKKTIHYVDAHIDFSTNEDNAITAAGKTPADFGTVTDATAATAAVAIEISKDAKTVETTRHWVTQSVVDALQEAIIAAEAVVDNAYSGAYVDGTATLGDIFEDNVTFSNTEGFYKLAPNLDGESSSPYAKKSNEEKYKEETLQGSDGDYSTLAEIDAAQATLNAAYEAYLAASNGTYDLATNIAAATLEIKIAKAMLGIDPKADLPKSANSSLRSTPQIYKYTGDSDAPATKATAKGITASSADILASDREGFGPDATYFIAPAVVEDAAAAKEITWTAPGGVKTEPKYITHAKVDTQLEKLSGYIETYESYDGFKPDGTTPLEGEDYTTEVKAGSKTSGSSNEMAEIIKDIAGIAPSIDNYTAFADSADTTTEEKLAKVTTQLYNYFVHLGLATTVEFTPAPPAEDALASVEGAGTPSPITLLKLTDGFTTAGLNDNHALKAKSEIDADNGAVAVPRQGQFNPLLASPATRADNNYYNISAYKGVDLDANNFWVTQSVHDDLVTAINTAKTYIKDSGEKDKDNTTPLYELNSTSVSAIEGYIKKLKEALDKYDEAAKAGLKTEFGTAITSATTALADVEQYVTLPVLEANATTGALSLTTGRAVKDGGTIALSDDGIFSITESSKDAADDYTTTGTDAEKKKLITEVNTSATHYVEVSDLDKLTSEARYLNELEEYAGVTVYGLEASAKTKLEKYMDDFVSGNLQKEIDDIAKAVATFEDSKQPIVPFDNTARGTLYEAVHGASSDGIITKIKKVDGKDEYYSTDTAVTVGVSEDGGYTYKTYNVTGNGWSDFISFADDSVTTHPAKWTTNEALKTYYNAIQAADKVLKDTFPSTLKDTNATPEDVEDTGSLGEYYSEVDWGSNIPDASETDFVAAKATLEAATAAYGTTTKEKAATTDAESALSAFETAIGVAYTATTAATNPPSYDALGYISSTDTTNLDPTAGSGQKVKVYAIENAEGEVTSYVPVDIYIVSKGHSDTIINSKKGDNSKSMLYGYDKTGAVDAVAGTGGSKAIGKFVDTDAVEDLSDALLEVDEILAKSDTDHYKAFANDPSYFDNALKKVEDAIAAYEAKTKEHDSAAYVTAYTSVQTHLTGDSSTTPTSAVNADTFATKDAADGPFTIEFATGTVVGGKIVENGIALDPATVNLSVDGVYTCNANGTATSTALPDGHWVTPTMFNDLKEAMVKAQEIVDAAATLESSSRTGYLDNPGNLDATDSYFATQYNESGLADAILAFKPTAVATTTTGDKDKWIEAAQVILYGDDKAIDTSDAPPTASANVDAFIGTSTDKGDYSLTSTAIKVAIDTTEDGVSDAELEAFIDSNPTYLDQTYATNLKEALAALEEAADQATAEQVADLAVLVNTMDANSYAMNPASSKKIALYNAYHAAKAVLKDANGIDVEISDTAGANISTSSYWVTSAVHANITKAIEEAETLLDDTAVNTSISTKATALANLAKNFKPLPGTATGATIKAFDEAKKALLDGINVVAALTNVNAYNIDGTQGTELATGKAVIVESKVYGTDVEGDDTNNDLIPDGGSKWVSTIDYTKITTALNTAVTALKNTKSTTATLQASLTALEKATTAFETAAQFGTKDSYNKVVATLRTYISNTEKGTFADDGAHLSAVESIAVSSSFGADVPATSLWTTTAGKNTITAATQKAATFLNSFANVDAPDKKTSLDKAILALKEMQTAYQNFYGYDVNGLKLDTITPLAQKGTDAIETVELRTAIQNAVTAINGLAYLPGATPPTATYTDADGLAGNKYENNDAGTTKVSVKAGGVDVPANTQWVASTDVNVYANAISVAQKTLDTFATAKVQSQLTIDKAVDALALATQNFEKATKPAAALSAEASKYNMALTKLNDAIAQATSTVINGNLAGGPLALLNTIKLSLAGDGSDVDSYSQWVNTLQYNAYVNAINNAKKVISLPTTLTLQLSNAYSAFDKSTAILTSAAAKNGMGKNDEMLTKIEELESLIKDIEAILYGSDRRTPIFASATGADVPDDSNWLPTAQITALNNQIKLATAAIFNTTTDKDPITGAVGTGKTTLASIGQTITSLKNSVTTATKLLKPGKLDSDLETADAVKAKNELTMLIAQAFEYTKYAQSDVQGNDVADGLAWVTEEDVDGFTVDGESESMAPKEFIIDAHKAASDVLKANPHTAEGSAAKLTEAIGKLELAIEQFANVVANKTPAGEAVAGDTLIGGLGTMDTLNTAKEVLTARIEAIKAYVETVVEVSSMTDESEDGDIYELAMGTLYSDTDSISAIETAIEIATDAISDLEDTATDAAKLTAGSLDGTTADDPAAAPTSALGHLNSAFELFSGIDDNHPKTNEDTTKIDKVKEKSKYAGTPLEQAVAAITAVLESDELIVVPALKTGTTDAMDTDGAKAHIETKLNEVITAAGIDMNITVDRSGTATPITAQFKVEATITGFTAATPGTAEEPDGEVGENEVSVKITLMEDDGTTAVTGTGIEPVVIEGEFIVAAAPYKWTVIEKSAVLEAASRIHSSREFTIDGNLLINADADKATRNKANALLAAKEIEKQVKALINNGDVEVYIVSEGFDAETGELKAENIFTTDTVDATAAYEPQVNKPDPEDPEAEDESEDGAFVFNIALRIPYAKANPGVATISTPAIEDELVEVVKDDASGADDTTNNEFYTVIFDETFEAIITPGEYLKIDAGSPPPMKNATPTRSIGSRIMSFFKRS
ncbi:hypothetical protein [Candidatus Epulonipiscium viviparus]|uniref:hypothetical protein n=1 Tax=Candidatus Epulonipiscium viviparus TaxID=420336 RepID=UPI00016C0431|nr:hypothetical protein [Candidatus Epulopiscium viviparus]